MTRVIKDKKPQKKRARKDGQASYTNTHTHGSRSVFWNNNSTCVPGINLKDVTLSAIECIVRN